MKEGKKYGELLLKLFTKLKRAYDSIEFEPFEEPVDAVVFACLSEYTSLENAQAILEDIQKHFVDINDLRVCRKEEMLEVIADRIDAEKARVTVQRLSQILNAVFNKYDKVSLAELGELGKREARKELEELEGVTPYVASYTLLTALDAHAIPLTERMIAHLHGCRLVHEEAQPEDIYGFIERVVPAKDAMLFYRLLRMEAESDKPVVPAKKKKASAKKKSEKKTTAAKSATKKTVQKKTAAKKTTKKKTAKKKTVKKKTTKKKTKKRS